MKQIEHVELDILRIPTSKIPGSWVCTKRVEVKFGTDQKQIQLV